MLNNPENKNNLSCPSVGLFWFSSDYSSLVRTEGYVEVSLKELINYTPNLTIEPDGCHLEYEKDLSIPRGRVVYGDGIFDICVGIDIPENTNIHAIKAAFGLLLLEDSKIRIFNDPHWNKKNTIKLK